MKIFTLAVIFSVILIAVFRFCLPSNWHIGKGVTFTKPEPFDKKQRQTFTLMILMMIVLLAFPIPKSILPANKTIANLNSKIDVGLVGIIFAVIALLMKLAPQKEAIARVPWNTIIMIAGAGMVIAVALKAGTIDMLASWIGSNVAVALVPIAFSIVVAFMSFFSSTTGVVAPALFPLIPACGIYRAGSGGTVCVYGVGSAEQRNQPVFFRRESDYGIMR